MQTFSQPKFKQASEAAKGMGVKIPGVQKLLDENEKEEKAQASEQAAETKKKEAAKRWRRQWLIA